jgi:hypothetical protein
MFINNTQKFLEELKKVSSKFEWYLQEKKYGSFVCNQITGICDDREYIPLTAVVKELSGKYYDPSFFDKAAGEVYMSSQVSSQIVDACDEWPDRLQGYKPKGFENKLRQDIIAICLK